ncbi:MAG: ArsR family transcriptional regulator [Sphingomonadales bacterium]|nr:ArsR family transcriptional regulator [Sphingomonadales bacterium]
MNAYAEHITENRRLAILSVLNEDVGFSHNDSVLQSALGALGHSITRDQVRTDLAWLAEQGMVTTTSPRNGLTVAKLTERGADVAAGRAQVPGIARPSPNSV